MKRIYSLVVAAFATLTLGAQQEYQVSHNMFNNAAINPGAAGVNDAICAYMIGRHQWIGFEGAPNTYVLNASAPLSALGGPNDFGAGITMFYDQLGIEQNLKFKLSGNYQKDMPNGVLSFGLDFGFLRKGINGTPDPTDLNDPLINGGSAALWKDASMAPDLGLGVFYKTNDLYFGVSTSQILQSSVDWGSAQPQLKRHYYVTGGYETEPMANGQLVLKPSVMIKTDGAVTTMDVNMYGIWNSAFYGGVSYRTGDAIVAHAGVMKDKLTYGIAYDFTTSAIKTYSSGTVELFVRYCMKIDPKPSGRMYVDPALMQ
jgi:type IX secretion system PorP/SprF family membrane protein